MAKFLLWNVNRKPLDSLVVNLVEEHEIDIVLLVEYAATSRLVNLLSTFGFALCGSSERFGVFCRSNHQLTRLHYRLGNRAMLCKWIPPSAREGLIALVHGQDRRNNGDGTRRMFFHRVVNAIRRQEKARGHRRTIIVGDFNAHPFESAVVSADGMHALGMRTIGTQSQRTIQGASNGVDYFYNPMWRLYGLQPNQDAEAATYFRMTNNAFELGWYMLDQVVLRPEEGTRFPENHLRILDRVGEMSIVDSQGRPDSLTASDHLPIVFHWDL